MMLRERTTIPRTRPRWRTIRWPARSFVVATSMGGSFETHSVDTGHGRELLANVKQHLERYRGDELRILVRPREASDLIREDNAAQPLRAVNGDLEGISLGLIRNRTRDTETSALVV